MKVYCNGKPVRLFHSCGQSLLLNEEQLSNVAKYLRARNVVFSR